MKKMIMMMIAASTLALGARAGTTVEWGLDGNAIWNVQGMLHETYQWNPEPASQVYIYLVIRADPQEYVFDKDANFLALHAQLQAGTFTGDDELILDRVAITSPSPWAGMDYFDADLLVTHTFFSDIEEGVSFALLYLFDFGDSYEYVVGATYDGKNAWLASLGYHNVGEGVVYFNLDTSIDAEGIIPYVAGPLPYLIPIAPIPEPATGLLALAGIALLIRRKRK